MTALPVLLYFVGSLRALNALRLAHFTVYSTLPVSHGSPCASYCSLTSHPAPRISPCIQHTPHRTSRIAWLALRASRISPCIPLCALNALRLAHFTVHPASCIRSRIKLKRILLVCQRNTSCFPPLNLEPSCSGR